MSAYLKFITTHLFMYSLFLSSIGIFAVGAGIVGIFVPLVPTTPFLLLAGWCFCRSSPRLHRWLLAHPWFGHYIKQYQEQRGIPRPAKILGLLMLWLSMGYLIIFVIQALWLRVLLTAIALAVSIYLLHLKTLSHTDVKASSNKSSSR